MKISVHLLRSPCLRIMSRYIQYLITSILNMYKYIIGNAEIVCTQNGRLLSWSGYVYVFAHSRLSSGYFVILHYYWRVSLHYTFPALLYYCAVHHQMTDNNSQCSIFMHVSTLAAEMFGGSDFWLETRVIIKRV